MIENNNFFIIGGDSRQLYMADYLENLGYEVQIYGLPESKRYCCKNLSHPINNYKNILLPLPVSRDGKHIFSIVSVKESIDELVCLLNENHRIFAGMISNTLKAKLEKNNSKVYDYFKREDVTVMNAVPTVQGILKTIIDNIEYTINSSKIAIFGYGRIGSLTADVLSSIGADITVCARSYSDLAKAKTKGYNTCFIKNSDNNAEEYNIVINTVPAVVINKAMLQKIRKDCLIIDVASTPYGVDYVAASELELNTILCPSLPGKVAPKTAGEIIANGVINIIKEEFDE